MLKSVVVFCSASDKVSPMYFSEMWKLGQCLAKHQIDIVFGGSKAGLMGALADSALKHNGRVIGVIPEYLNKPGIVHEGLTELIVVSDLLDRKRKMLSLADAAIASPGGVGTIDEITEVMALKQLGEHQKPIVFHNFLSFWNPLLEYFEELSFRSMIHQDLRSSLIIRESAQEVLEFLKDPSTLKVKDV